MPNAVCIICRHAIVYLNLQFLYFLQIQILMEFDDIFSNQQINFRNAISRSTIVIIRWRSQDFARWGAFSEHHRLSLGIHFLLPEAHEAVVVKSSKVVKIRIFQEKKKQLIVHIFKLKIIQYMFYVQSAHFCKPAKKLNEYN